MLWLGTKHLEHQSEFAILGFPKPIYTALYCVLLLSLQIHPTALKRVSLSQKASGSITFRGTSNCNPIQDFALVLSALRMVYRHSYTKIAMEAEPPNGDTV